MKKLLNKVMAVVTGLVSFAVLLPLFGVIDGRSEIPHEIMAGPILQEKNGRSDFADVYWLIDLKYGVTPKVELVDDYADPAECAREARQRALLQAEGWSTCIPAETRQ